MPGRASHSRRPHVGQAPFERDRRCPTPARCLARHCIQGSAGLRFHPSWIKPRAEYDHSQRVHPHNRQLFRFFENEPKDPTGFRRIPAHNPRITQFERWWVLAPDFCVQFFRTVDAAKLSLWKSRSGWICAGPLIWTDRWLPRRMHDGGRVTLR